MGAGTSPANERDMEREALATTLEAAFAAGRFRWLGNSFLYATAVPSGALWIHSWRPLPELVVWFAAFGWASCAGLALLSGAAAWRWQARFEGARPESPFAARVTFVHASPLPALSGWLAALALMASIVLWLNAEAPGLLSGDLLARGRDSWLVLAVLAIGARSFETGA